MLSVYHESAECWALSRVPCVFANALHLGVAHGSVELVEVMLRAGLDPNGRAVCTCPYPLLPLPRRHSSQQEGETAPSASRQCCSGSLEATPRG